MKKHTLILLICLTVLSAIGNVGASEFYSRDLLWSLEFEDNLGGAENYTYAEFNLWLDGGTMAAHYIDGKPYMELNAFPSPLAADNTDSVEIGISSENDMMLKFYFATDRADGWSEDRTFIFYPSGGNEMNVYTLKTSAIKDWKDNIKRLRMDFIGADGYSATNTLNIDYIRIFGKQTSSVKSEKGGLLYDFDKNSSTDGWRVNAENAEAELEGGKLNFSADGAKSIETCSLGGVSAADYGNISISMKNNTAADKARLYFSNTAGGDYTDSFEFDIMPNDTKFRTYNITTGAGKSWAGDINALKFDFGADPGSISIDEIYLRKYPYKVNIDDENITISGETEPLSVVSVQLADSDADLDGAAASGNYSDAVIFTDETKADANGKFSFICATPNSSGAQRFAVTLSEGERVYHSNASFVDSGYANRILQNYNSAVTNSDGALAESIVEESYDFLGINSAGYAEYLAAYKTPGILGAQLVYLGTAQNLAELESKISRAAVFASIKVCEKEVLAALAEKYENTLQLSADTAYDIYNTL